MTVKERHMRIVGVLANVSLACDFVVAQAREAGLDERAIHHCYLAVDEACTNVVEHGYGLKCQDCVIDVTCRFDGDAFAITVADDSPPFDPLTRPDPDPSAPLNERAPGGWGIFFIKKLMDEVSYSYEANRNRLVMVKRARKPAPVLQAPETSARPPISAVALLDKMALITPKGRLDDTQNVSLETVLNSQLGAGRKWLILNMAEVDYISSAGLKTLVSVWQRVRDQKGDLALAALKPRVREVLEMIGLDLVFTITDTAEQASRQFAAKLR